MWFIWLVPRVTRKGGRLEQLSSILPVVVALLSLSCSTTRKELPASDNAGTPLPTLELRPSGGLNTLRSDLRQVIREERDSYHLLLWRAMHLVGDACDNQPWPKVAHALRKQNFVLLRNVDGQHGRYSRYLVQRAVFQSRNGAKFDMFLEFNTHRDISTNQPTVEVVAAVYATTDAKVELPFSQFAARQPFPEGTVLQRLLEAKEVRESAEKYPILKDLEVCYRSIWFHSTVPSHRYCGFYVRPTFVLEAGKECPGMSLSLAAESGLDPVMIGGVMTPTNEFLAADTLDGFSTWGSTECPASKRPYTMFTLARVNWMNKQMNSRNPWDDFTISRSRSCRSCSTSCSRRP